MCLLLQRGCRFRIADHQTQIVPVVENLCAQLSHVGGLLHACKVSGKILTPLFQLFGTPTVDTR